MAEEAIACPGCGATVYATDFVCMSCGTTLNRPLAESTPAPSSLSTKAPPAEPPLAPVVSHRRPRVDLPIPPQTQIVLWMGEFWHWYPWIGMIISLCVARFGLQGVPLPWAILFGAVAGLWYLTSHAWVILDVFYTESGWWWIPIAIFGYPIGLIFYLMRGRED